jgi:shikimate kinase
MKTGEKGKSILLCGLPGSGKSETGRILADLMDLPFIDLDRYIEENEEETISDIFSESGEAYFREIEADTLEKLLEIDEQRIIALGGGTLGHDRVWPVIEKSGAITVWLLVKPEMAAERLERGNMISSLPLLKGLRGEGLQKRIEHLFENRRGDYASCMIFVDPNDAGSDEVAARILEKIEDENY